MNAHGTGCVQTCTALQPFMPTTSAGQPRQGGWHAPGMHAWAACMMAISGRGMAQRSSARCSLTTASPGRVHAVHCQAVPSCVWLHSMSLALGTCLPARPQLKDRAAVEAYKPGQQLDVASILKEGETVDIAGLTVGKGFQGACVRCWPAGRPCTHGSSPAPGMAAVRPSAALTGGSGSSCLGTCTYAQACSQAEGVRKSMVNRRTSSYGACMHVLALNCGRAAVIIVHHAVGQHVTPPPPALHGICMLPCFCHAQAPSSGGTTRAAS